jgi:hypothetical protein
MDRGNMGEKGISEVLALFFDHFEASYFRLVV